jgi:hypothetical protein
MQAGKLTDTGGTYAVPAFRPASSLPAAVATCSWIPNATPPAIPHEATMVADLDSRLGTHAAGYSRYSFDASVATRSCGCGTQALDPPCTGPEAKMRSSIISYLSVFDVLNAEA